MSCEESDVLTAIFVSNVEQNRRFGVATLRKESKRITVCEMADNEQYTTLEAVLVQIRPRSICAFISDPKDKTLISHKLEDLCEEVIIKQRTDFKETNLTEDLEKLVTDAKGGDQRFRAALVLLERYPLAKGPLACLIQHYNLLAVENYARSLTVTTHQVNSALQLDRAALMALNVFPQRKPGESAALAAASSSTAALGSLYGVLNRTRTAMGARKLAFWLSQPLIDVDEIKRRHDVVEAFSSATEVRQVLQADYMRRLPDLARLSVKLRALNAANAAVQSQISKGSSPDSKDVQRLKSSAMKLFTLEDLVKVYDGLCVAHALDAYLDSTCSDEGSDFYRYNIKGGAASASWARLVSGPVKDAVSATRKLLLLVERTVDLDEARVGRYVVNRNMDQAFAQVAAERDAVKKNMDSERSRVGADLMRKGGGGKKASSDDAGSSVKLLKDNSHGWVFRVPKKDHPVVSKMPGVTSIALNKAEFIFTTTKLSQLVRDVRDIEVSYDSLQAALAYKACTVAATYHLVIDQLAGTLASLDVLLAFGLVAATAPVPYCRPTMEGGLCLVKTDEEFAAGVSIKKEEVSTTTAGPPDGMLAEAEDDLEATGRRVWVQGQTLSLTQCRHPIAENVGVAASALTGSGGEFFANDFHVSKAEGKPRVMVVTGPNMGGKSTYLRQIALCCLMAQVGSLVPAEKATLPVLRQILCRVGANDMQLRGISTFFHEMSEASAILSAATADSLVIIDELGRGTSTSDGFGLAWAIAKDLAERCGCFGVFATHFHEMAQLSANTTPAGLVGNLHVSAAINSVQKKITFLYKVLEGGCSLSYGVDVAAIAGVPAKAVDRARRKIKELEKAEELTRVHCRDEEEEEGKKKKPKILEETEAVIKDLFASESAQAFAEKVMQKKEQLLKLRGELSL